MAGPGWWQAPRPAVSPASRYSSSTSDGSRLPVAGTAAYLALEQLRGAPVDPSYRILNVSKYGVCGALLSSRFAALSRRSKLMENVRDETVVASTATEIMDPLSESSFRASHAEREATAARLHAALGEGRLDLAETEERLAVAYAARYRWELNPLLADLPAPEPLGLRAGWAQLWRALVVQTWVSSARARGAASAQPDRRERRVTTIVIIAAVCWMVLCLLFGLAVGLVG